MLFRTCSQTLHGHDQVVTLGEPLAQVIPPRGPFMVSRKLAMKDEPNEKWSRRLDNFPKVSCVLFFAHAVFHHVFSQFILSMLSLLWVFLQQLQQGPLFRRIGPRVSQEMTFTKTQRSFSDETPCVRIGERGEDKPLAARPQKG